jgi:hypothetical protein
MLTVRYLGWVVATLVNGSWSAANMLLEYVIPRDRKPELADALAVAGTAYSTICPDLTGLASDPAFRFPIAREH